MARKGSTKVRTGCLTCRIRRVKCDEAKPDCLRCTSTGRRCDGYVNPPPPRKQTTASKRGSQLATYKPSNHQALASSQDFRAFRYFCQVAAPKLSGPLESDFWTHVVTQISTSEAAIKHAMLAVSLLYEFTESAQAASARTLAIAHYNSAIRELRQVQDQPLVLVCCVLFVCIEFMNNNRFLALQHSQHGIAIIEQSEQTSLVKDNLLPVFRRLSVLSMWFGVGVAANTHMPILRLPPPEKFTNLADAQNMMDDIFNRAIQLGRLGDTYRVGPKRLHEVPEPLLAEQTSIEILLDRWMELFLVLKPTLVDPEKIRLSHLLLMRHEYAHISTATAFHHDERCFDDQNSRFRIMMDLAATTRIPSSGHPPFAFEMGFTPLLFFVACKCRDLQLRLRALRLFEKLSIPRENLFNGTRMRTLCRSFIEFEHCIVLDEFDYSRDMVHDAEVPGSRRVESFEYKPFKTLSLSKDGGEVENWLITLYTRSLDGFVTVHRRIVRPGDSKMSRAHIKSDDVDREFVCLL